jgi:hypothetical protein
MSATDYIHIPPQFPDTFSLLLDEGDSFTTRRRNNDFDSTAKPQQLSLSACMTLGSTYAIDWGNESILKCGPYTRPPWPSFYPAIQTKIGSPSGVFLVSGVCERLREIAQEVRNVRFLERGTVLRNGLSQDWRKHGGYFNALVIIEQAFIQEHFSMNSKPETGVLVMSIKRKGNSSMS